MVPMKKAKPKTRARKKRAPAAKKSRPKRGATLQARLQTEFTEAVKSAQSLH